MKRGLALALAACLMIALAAAASAATEVKIWHTFTEGQQAALEKYAADFNASQSDYTVILESQAFSGFTDAVYQATANGVGPSIIFNYGSEAAKYVPDNKVVNLKPYIYDPEIGMIEVYESMPDSLRSEVEGFEKEGVYYLPSYTTGPVLFYNKTLFDEMGFEPAKTWDELAEQSKAIYEEKGISGYTGADGLTDLMQTLILQSGSTYIDVANKVVGFDNEETLKWLTWYGENVQNEYFLDGPTISDYISSDFNAGNVASYSGSCAGEPYIDPNGFEFSCAPLPKAITKEWYPSWNRGPIVFDKGDDTNRGAYLFVRYLLTPEVNADWVKQVNALSPYGTTQACDAYKEYSANLTVSLQALQANLDVAGALPNVTGSARIRDALKETAQKVGGGMDPAEQLKTLVETCNKALQGN
ncbi:MAG: extracellular solute-binding protein [Clostridiales bacterium]|nr:extracellular solute-binding protein [Clostridiales bacterium]